MKLRELVTGILIIFVVLTALTIEAHAEVNVIVQSYSWHSNPKYSGEELAEYDHTIEIFGEDWFNEDQLIKHRNYNETNKTFGIEWIGDRHGFSTGVYVDSFYTRAKWVAGLWLPHRTKHVDLGLMYGLVKSPSYVKGDIVPMVIPYFALKAGYIGVNFIALPKATSNGAWVVGMQYKLMF